MGKEPDDKEILLDFLVTPIGWIPFVGWPSSLIIKKALGSKRGGMAPGFSTPAIDITSDMAVDAYNWAKYINYAMNDKRVKGGWASEDALETALLGTARDTIKLFGFPGDFLDIFKEDKKKKKGRFSI